MSLFLLLITVFSFSAGAMPQAEEDFASLEYRIRVNPQRGQAFSSVFYAAGSEEGVPEPHHWVPASGPRMLYFRKASLGEEKPYFEQRTASYDKAGQFLGHTISKQYFDMSILDIWQKGIYKEFSKDVPDVFQQSAAP